MTKRRKRTVRKLALPLIAVGLMTLMMATHRGSAAATPAAQLPHASLGR